LSLFWILGDNVAFSECDLRKDDGYGGNTPTVGHNRRLRHHFNPDTKVFL